MTAAAALLLAVLLGDLGRGIEAREQLKAILAEHPLHAGAANNLAMIMVKDNPEGALQLIRPILDQGEHPLLWDTYGWILHKQGRTKEAWPWIQRAARYLPNNPEVIWHFADLLHASSREEEALRVLKALVPTGWAFPGGDEAKALYEQLAEPGP